LSGPGRSQVVCAPGLFFALRLIQTNDVTANDIERRIVDLFDVEAVEAAEAQLDAFVERRAREAKDAAETA